MGYVFAAVLFLASLLVAAAGFMASLGETLCDNGQCPPPSATDEILFGIAPLLLAAAISVAVVQAARRRGGDASDRRERG